MTALPKLLTAAQLADELGLSDKRQVYRWHTDHGLPALSVGRSLLFPEAAARAWIESRLAGETSLANDVSPGTNLLRVV